jgi:citrate synthase
MDSEGRWLSAEQAGAALGVRRSTLYAYVSRGLLARRFDRDGAGRRVSRFDRSQIVSLAMSRTRERPGTVSALIESDVSALGVEGTLALRGVAIDDLVAGGSFEDAARRVLQTHSEWPTLDGGSEVAGFVGGPSSRSADTIRVALMHAAGNDPQRDDLDVDHCRRVGMLAVEVGCMAVTGLPASSGSIAARLGTMLVGSADLVVVRCIDVALTLLIDHELTASTLAARAAAGVRADPWMAILAGQCAMSGPGQAGASRPAVAVLRGWLDGTPPPTGGPVPGFGHRVYVGADPRFELLVAEVSQLDPGLAADVERLCVEVARTRSRYPNVDLALAALIVAAGLDADCGELLFTLARTVGLAAHAIEEYPHGLRLRPRALAGSAELG